MDTSSSQPPSLEKLLADLMGDQLDDADWERLQRILLTDRAARAQYIDLISLDALLYWEGRGASELAKLRLGDSVSLEQSAGVTESSMDDAALFPAIREDEFQEPLPIRISAVPKNYASDAPSGSRWPHANWRGRTARWATVAAALLLSATALIALLRYFHPSPQPIAMGQSLDADWADSKSIQTPGNLIQIGVPQSLASGYVELTSANGLAIVIQGPANFTVQMPGVIMLSSGKLTASVPRQARGFTVNTPVASVVDLGTEFGVAVSADGQTDVQTFRGTVSVAPIATSDRSAPKILVTAGAARRIATHGDISEIAAGASAFVQPQLFQEWNALPRETAYERWSAYSQRLRHDPDLVAYYTFDNAAQAPDRLVNQSSDGPALDGIFGGDDANARPTWTTGRWPEKGALAFTADNNAHIIVHSGIGDPLDFSRGNETASPFTIAAWVRTDDTRRDGFAGIIAKGLSYAEQFGLDTGSNAAVRGWVRKAEHDDHRVQSPPPPTGKWTHFAMTYDPVQPSLKLYRDGAFMEQTLDPTAQLRQTDQPVTIGARRDVITADGVIHYKPSFDRRIDELLVLRRAITAQQVRDMYLSEKPD